MSRNNATSTAAANDDDEEYQPDASMSEVSNDDENVAAAVTRTIEAEARRVRRGGATAPNPAAATVPPVSTDSADWHLATVRGQLAADPTLTPEQAKSNAKREYNRLNASRARKRNKSLVVELQRQVNQLQQRCVTAERDKSGLEGQVQFLTHQNRRIVGMYEELWRQQPGHGPTVELPPELQAIMMLPPTSSSTTTTRTAAPAASTGEGGSMTTAAADGNIASATV